jgi:hypothetical protein
MPTIIPSTTSLKIKEPLILIGIIFTKIPVRGNRIIGNLI